MEYAIINGELYHWGVKGQKWGVRRYQNKDGSLTAAGKKRKYITVRQAAKNATNARKEAVRELNESPKKHTLAQYTRAANNAHKKSIAADKAANKHMRVEAKAKKKELNNLQNMSDEELRRRVNRLQMEKQYKQLSGTDVARGKKYLNNIMKTGTTIATVTTTGLTIYNNAGKIRNIIEGAMNK